MMVDEVIMSTRCPSHGCPKRFVQGCFSLKLNSTIPASGLPWLLRLLKLVKIIKIMIRMITKIITRTTNALAKLSGSPHSVMVRSGMP